MKNGITIPTCKWIRIFEAFLEIIFKIVGVYISYLLFNLLGEFFLGDKYQSETVYSLLLLPTLYVLKGAHIIIPPYFVVVKISENEVQSRTGIFTHRLDKLQLKIVENIEIISTLLARVFNYSTILLCGHGSWIRLPYVVHPKEIQKQIERNLENVRGKSISTYISLL
ncbi:PH domain-containing protein [Colwellia piezophila]|uniref:PH domain-containing protein n=1 Tax=Colwellia piezophila TaxID=211668 RepID=UPI000364BDF7|nr:PH domain-containing protein [Colwellia piezophila]